MKFMNTCSFTMHLKKINVFYKVFVKCICCFDELEEVSSSSSLQLASLTP
jgi:hypothetical protein